MFESSTEIEKILSALGEQLDTIHAVIPELVVCGGSALNILGFVSRTTKDVDVVAFIERSLEGNVDFKKAKPFPPELVDAMKKVARDFDLPEDWLNSGPASALDLGLPEGLIERVETKRYGESLTIHFLGRYDQIHFKLYAAADQGIGKHYDDLLALKPTSEELEKAARWSMTHDVSETYRQSIKDLLKYMEYEDVADKL